MMNQPNEKEKRFIEIYQTYADDIYYYIYLRCGNIAVQAEDITQDIFMDVYRGMDHFEERATLKTWIFQIAKNKLYDFYRKQYRRQDRIKSVDETEMSQYLDTEQDMEKLLEEQFLKQQVTKCLVSIKDEYRMILLLKYLDENSIKEISYIIGKTPKACESLLKRARVAFIKSYQNIKNEEEQK